MISSEFLTVGKGERKTWEGGEREEEGEEWEEGKEGREKKHERSREWEGCMGAGKR